MKRQLWMIALIAVLGVTHTADQQQGNIWICSTISLDFNINPPTFFPADIDGGEGIANIADRSGKQWLFYTNGGW